jgi:hypothetical protein
MIAKQRKQHNLIVESINNAMNKFLQIIVKLELGFRGGSCSSCLCSTASAAVVCALIVSLAIMSSMIFASSAKEALN